jgi:hypothetical protein
LSFCRTAITNHCSHLLLCNAAYRSGS